MPWCLIWLMRLRLYWLDDDCLSELLLRCFIRLYLCYFINKLTRVFMLDDIILVGLFITSKILKISSSRSESLPAYDTICNFVWSTYCISFIHTLNTYTYDNHARERLYMQYTHIDPNHVISSFCSRYLVIAHDL